MPQSAKAQTLHSQTESMDARHEAESGLERARGPSGGYAGLLALQRVAGNRAVTGALRSVLAPADSTPGRPLDPAVQSEMEARFARDFSPVRIHTDGQAAASAMALGAKAYTIGSQVVFGAGRYAPLTAAGKRLLAHELTHVVQQSRGGPPPALDAGSPLEQDAARAAEHAVSGHEAPVAVAGASGPGIARDQDDNLPFWQRTLNPLYNKALQVLPQPLAQKAEEANEYARQLVERHHVSDEQLNAAVQAAAPVLEPLATALGVKTPITPASAKSDPKKTVWLGRPPASVQAQRRKEARQAAADLKRDDPLALPPPEPWNQGDAASGYTLDDFLRQDPPPTDFEAKIRSGKPFTHTISPQPKVDPRRGIWIGRRPTDEEMKHMAFSGVGSLAGTSIGVPDPERRWDLKLTADDVMPIRDPKTHELKGYRVAIGDTRVELDRNGNPLNVYGVERPLETPVVDPIDVALIAVDLGPLVAKGVVAGGKALAEVGATAGLRGTSRVGTEEGARVALKKEAAAAADDLAGSGAKGELQIDLGTGANPGPPGVKNPNYIQPVPGRGTPTSGPKGNLRLAAQDGVAVDPAIESADMPVLRDATTGQPVDVGSSAQPGLAGGTSATADDATVAAARRGGKPPTVGGAGPGGPQGAPGGFRRVPTSINPQASKRALDFTARRAGGKVISIPQGAELYAESLVRQGAVPQIGKLDRVVAGQLGAGSGLPAGAGKDLWGFRNGNPVSVEIKNYSRDLTSVKTRPRLEGTQQISPTGDKMDWLTWVKTNPKRAQDLVDSGVLDKKWLDISEGGYVRRNAANHFLRAGNRYAIVISPQGQAGVAPRVLQDLKLPPGNVIQLAIP